jgi:hypothetical protein
VNYEVRLGVLNVRAAFEVADGLLDGLPLS